MTVYVNGKVSNDLTNKTDYVEVTGTGSDVVYGTFTEITTWRPPGNTFTSGDEIDGNGLTTLKLSVSNWSAGTVMPGVEVEGVRALKLKNLQSPGAAAGISLDATNWGTDLSRIDVSGAKYMDLTVTNLTTAGTTLRSAASGDAQSVDIVQAKVGTAVVDMNVKNVTTDQYDATALVTKSKMDVDAGGGDVADVKFTNAVAGDVAYSSVVATTYGGTADLTVDLSNVTKLSIGTLMSLGNDTDVIFEAKGNAISKTTIDYLGAGSGDADLALYIRSTSGAVATSGNVRVKDTVITNIGATGLDVTVEASSIGSSGGTVGSVKFDSIDMTSSTGGTTNLVIALEAKNTGTASANASVGSVNLQDVDIIIGAGSKTNLDVDVTAAADAVSGTANATVGNVKVGSLDVTAYEAGSLNAFNVSVKADADKSSGNAKVGNVTVGDIYVAGATGDVLVTFDVKATAGAKTGDATIGNITFGKVDVATSTGKAYVDIDFTTVDGTKTSSIGDFTIGSVEFDTAGGDIDFDIELDSSGTIGDVTVGDIDVADTGKGATASVSVDVSADYGVGDVDLGKLSIDTAGKIEAFAVFVEGSEVGDVDIGDISIKSSGVIDAAKDDVGVYVIGTKSSVGTVDIGDVSFTTTKGSSLTGEVDIDVSAAADIGAIKVGDVTLSATESDAKIDSDLLAGGKLTSASFGVVDITTSTDTTSKANASFDVSLNGGTDGVLTIEELDIDANASATKASDVTVTLTSGGGNIVLTDGIDAGGVEAGAGKAAVDVNITTAAAGTVSIGDVTVVGANTTISDLNVNAATSWLDVKAGAGNVSIGDVDYSGYTGVATIDLYGTGADAWKGGETIKASAGGSTILGNLEQNTIVLYENNGGDTIIFKGIQNNKTDLATADLIENFKSVDDTITIDVTTVGNATNGGAYTTYGAFITDANTAFAGGDSAYFADAGDYYVVAVDEDSDGTTDYLFKVEADTLTVGDFAII